MSDSDPFASLNEAPRGSYLIERELDDGGMPAAYPAKSLRSVFATFITLAACLLAPCRAQAQTGAVQGVVRSAGSGAPLSGADVSVIGTRVGTITAADGTFRVGEIPLGPQIIKVNRIGFADAYLNAEIRVGETSLLEIFLTTLPIPISGISVSGSRRLERVTDAPVSLSLVTSQALARATPLTYADVLQGTRGLDTYRGGVDQVVVSARGFTTAYNYRMRVLVDHKNGSAVALGVPAGNFYPVAREDIDRMEAVLGPSSALYGPNAHNGLLHIITKHPRDHPGTTLVAGVGVNSIFSGRIRHAAAYEQFAYKLNAEYFSGTDWTKSDTVGVDDGGRFYVDEAGEHLEHLRTSGSFYYFPSEEVQVVASAGFAGVDGPITLNTGRAYGEGARLDFQQLRVETPRFFAQAYRTGNAYGNTHAIEAKVAFQVAAANAGSPITEREAISMARTIEHGYRLNYEMQYNERFALGGTDLTVIAGVQHEDVRPDSEGTLFTEGRIEPSDPVTGQLRLRQSGLYGQIEAALDERWRLIFAGRFDTHSKYEVQMSPRAALVYRLPDTGTFRLTYNRAFQAPEIIQLELLREAGSIPGTSIPVVVRGNGDGYTLSDGTVIPPLSPERNTTFEAGYKGLFARGVFLDVNAYRSRYENFLSPLIPITDPATGVSPVALGEHPLSPFPSQYVLTIRNFGRVNLNGLDVGVTYQFNDRATAWANYSHMSLVDLEDPVNDFNGDGTFEELSFNAPENKASFGVGLSDLFTTGLYASMSGRWVQAYDFIAGVHRATKAGEGTGSFWSNDRGPLGGFTTFDVNVSYSIDARTQLNLSATNVLDEGHRETVASPEIRRLIITELKYTLR